VHIVAASHRNLREQVALGRFRQDLFFRLEQHDVALPPLRERLEEIPWLLQRGLGEPALTLHSQFVEATLLRCWPGNVRELLSEARRAGTAAVQAQSPTVRLAHLRDEAGRELEQGQAPVRSPSGPVAAPSTSSLAPEPRGRKWSPLTKEGYVAALAQHGGNRAATARALGMQRTQLYRELQRVGLVAVEDAVPEDEGDSSDEA
jgi:DNA-binding NtrC family response regulator